MPTSEPLKYIMDNPSLMYQSDGKMHWYKMLTLKAASTTAADDKFATSFPIFEKNKV